MKCKKVRKKFSLIRDGELPPAEVLQLQGHLDQCESCQADWLLFEQAMGCLTPMEKETVSPAVWVRFRQAVAQEKEEEATWWGQLELFSLRLSGAVAVSLALFLFAWTLYEQSQQVEQLAAQNFFTKSQYGKVLSVF